MMNLMMFILCLALILTIIVSVLDWRDRRKFVQKDMSLFQYYTGKKIPIDKDYPRKEIIS